LPGGSPGGDPKGGHFARTVTASGKIALPAVIEPGFGITLGGSFDELGKGIVE